MAEVPDSAALDRIEDSLSLLPNSLELGDALVEEFRRRRARIHQRHNEWRRGMPTIDDLFDNDEHRAKALAGSLATEFERTLVLHGEMAAEFVPSPEWPGEFAVEWSAMACRLAECWAWGTEANVMFELVLEDLSAQAVRRAKRGERPRSARSEVHISRLRRLGIMGARTLKRFFRPPPAGH